jgi:hypothetical protein
VNEWLNGCGDDELYDEFLRLLFYRGLFFVRPGLVLSTDVHRCPWSQAARHRVVMCLLLSVLSLSLCVCVCVFVCFLRILCVCVCVCCWCCRIDLGLAAPKRETMIAASISFWSKMLVETVGPFLWLVLSLSSSFVFPLFWSKMAETVGPFLWFVLSLSSFVFPWCLF